MVLGKKCESYGSGLVRSTSFGRKRITVDVDFSPITTPMKKVCSHNSFFFCDDKSPLEALPQDILIRIVCGVDHDDLKRLFHVSRTIREATVIAKRWHFEYATPRKTLGFKNAIEDLGEFNDVEAPNAPRQLKIRKLKLSRKKLADISVALFASEEEEDDDDNWLQRKSFMQMDAEL
ncbi:F-box protein At1g61340-like [Nicotiana tabacum]|uniref:F-box protein At1g61340-like n=2 Tax=Nicotiana TaxID=4085 RepID=A0A1S3ZMU5_TOBAC|nr:PREDICTED: F-box protein At1g61340-like [Nicotiana sylvestris]XP_016465682.1 PREDICTED: F-box protein At1g61340-like [Nicotiana tabacum]XP_016465683.1 PREDICTED: F-box protein At1g61340-like [Nicotiana tabacum]